MSHIHLADLVYAVNCRTQGKQGPTMSRLIGRGTRGNLPNSWERRMDWRTKVQKRGESRQRRMTKKERTVGKKEIGEKGEKVKLQDMKIKLGNVDGTIVGICTAQDGIIVSYMK